MISTDDLDRYNQYDHIVQNGRKRLESFSMPEVLEVSGDYWVVPSTHQNRLDMIAHKFLGTPLLWWVIAMANDIKDPFNIPTGTSLLIPDEQTVLKFRRVL